MADLKPKKINLAEINGGVQYEVGDGVQPNAINDTIQASAYAQALATNQPNLENVDNFGVPKVSIEEVDGLPRFKFENLNAVEVSSMEQVESSTQDGGKNVFQFTLNNGETQEFTVYNGRTGAKLVSRVLQGEDQDGGNIYLDTFDDGTTAYFTAPRGRTTDKISDWMGKEQIGDEYHYIYYDGEKFVARPVNIEDNTTDWGQIAFASKQIASGEKTPEELGLAVGQERKVMLSTGEEVTFVILGFNHDDLSDDSGKAGITFGMKNLLATKYVLSTEYVASYSEMTIRNTLAEMVLTLPSDLQSVIKSVKKKFVNLEYIHLDETVPYNKLFLFSTREIKGKLSVYTGDDGTQYKYYVDNPDVIKYLAEGQGAKSDWATRTLSGFAVSIFNTDGDFAFHTVSSDTPSGICFGFCV